MAKRKNQKQEEAAATEQQAEQVVEPQAEAQEETQEQAQPEAKEESRLAKDIAEALKPYRHQLQTPDGAQTVRTIVRNLAQQEANITITKQGKVIIDLASGERLEV